MRHHLTAGPDWKPGGLHSYHAQPPSTLKGSGLAAASPGRDRRKPRTKTKFPSLTPAPGAYRVSGDTKAAEAVAHARKTWAPPALRTQAISSYGAVPDLEVRAIVVGDSFVERVWYGRMQSPGSDTAVSWAGSSRDEHEMGYMPCAVEERGAVLHFTVEHVVVVMSLIYRLWTAVCHLPKVPREPSINLCLFWRIVPPSCPFVHASCRSYRKG